jgi:hypothetical protein
MMTNRHDFNLAKRNRFIGMLILCLVMIASTIWTDSNTIALATDEMEVCMENTHKECIPPLIKINAAVIWDGAVTIESVGYDFYLQCAGVEAKILLSKEESNCPATRLYGFGGEPISIDELMEMDLSFVHVNMRLTEDQAYVVRWLVVGPALTLRGKITELDPELETFIVQGFTVSVTENTRLHKLRIFHCCPPIDFSDLKVGTRVRTVAHYDEEGGNYLGLIVLAAMPPRFHGEDGTDGIEE